MLPSFAVFEMIVEETVGRGGEWYFEYDELESISALQDQFGTTTPVDAIKHLKKFIENYFKERNLQPVLDLKLDPPTAVIKCKESAEFVIEARKLRSNIASKAGKQFENLVASQLYLKMTGTVLNLGYPRKSNKYASLISELQKIGLECARIGRKTKDGGLDIVCLPPLGKIDNVPFLNFQCKNSEAHQDKALFKSFSDATSMCSRHRLFTTGHSFFIVLNTYLTDEIIETAYGHGFAFIGIAELLSSMKPTTKLINL